MKIGESLPSMAYCPEKNHSMMNCGEEEDEIAVLKRIVAVLRQEVMIHQGAKEKNVG